jgi:glycosyltransferase involved in cell wall biosynthesis
VKIVFLDPSGQLGGAERVLLDFVATLRSAEPGWSLFLIAGSDGPLVAEATALGVHAEVLPFPGRLARFGDAAASGPVGDRISRGRALGRLVQAAPGVVRYLARLRRLLHAIAPDVVHANGLKMHIAAAWARPRHASLVWHVHDYVRSRPIASRLVRAHAAMCEVAVANSRSVVADLQALVGARVSVRLIYNGVDLNRFSPDGPALDLDALAGLHEAGAGTVRIGLLGTLSRWKGHEVFLDAISRLPRVPPVRAYVIGDALYETIGSQWTIGELRRVANRLGISERVGFTGFVREPAAAIRALDVVVHASITPEPFGLVIAEAMACGRAVVISDTAGAAELAEVGSEVLSHRPGNVTELAERITRLARDPDLRMRLGKAARVAAERRFDRARLAEELIPIYRGLAQKRGQ